MPSTALPPLLTADARFDRAVQAAPPMSVSAVLATYNRCPFDPNGAQARDNPLVWALESLLCQAGPALAAIVVADDGSTDHTPAVLGRYHDQPGIPIRTVRLPGHQGAAAARNAAVAAAGSRWLLFGDDDCVFTPYTASGAAYTLHTLRNTVDDRAAAVMVPFYYRALQPRQTHPVAHIGRLDPASAQFATHFHTWPAEYGTQPPLLDDSGIVAPLPVQLIGGTCLIDRQALDHAGGFVDLSDWKSSYSDHLHLSADLTDTGARLYHCPDPRLGAAHLKWGAVGRYPLDPVDLGTWLPGLGRRFADLVDLSAVPRQDTGCRVADDDFHAEMIGSFFAFFAGRSLPGARRWAGRCWRDFVEHGIAYSSAVAAVTDRPGREQAWCAGLRRGALAVTGGLRPGRSREQITELLALVCADAGQPPIDVS